METTTMSKYSYREITAYGQTAEAPAKTYGPPARGEARNKMR
jgi:hypothetical protein